MQKTYPAPSVTDSAERPGPARKKMRNRGRLRPSGNAIVWPNGVEDRYGISAPTRWRWEKDGRLPPRDVFIGGVPAGWKPATLDAADRGELPTKQPSAVGPKAA